MTASASLRPRAPGLALRPLALASLLLLGGCVTPGPQSGVGSLATGLTSMLPRATPVDASAPTGGAAAGAAWTPLAESGTPPLATRPPQGISTLLAKGTVRGDELLGEMIAMRQHMQRQRSMRAIAGFAGSLDSMAANPINISSNLRDTAFRLALDALLQTMRDQAMSVAFNALESHMAMMIDDPTLLQRETIRLPSPQGLTAVQQQRAVTMGAIVVMARVTNQVLAKARKDFEGIEAEYGQLLARREKAAEVLYQALARGSSGRDQVAAVLRKEDMEFLDGGLARMPLADFARDLGAQNVALAYLARTDPGAFAAYRTQSDGLLGRTRGFLRLSSGAVAFSGMVSVFAQETLTAVRGKQAPEILSLLPMAVEFVAEAPTLVKVALEAGSEGVLVPFKSSKRFRVVQGDAGMAELSSAREVFAELDKREATPVLREALFRNGSSGLLHKMFLCSPPEAGRLLDAALPVAERDSFAKAFIAPDIARYSFANAFETPADRLRPKERELGDELLRDDQRERARSLEIARLQQKVAEGGFKSWTNEQLMRLIFSNREGLAQHATLQLGTVSVRPVASAESVFAYESLVDACRGLVQLQPARATPAPTAAPAPQAHPPRPQRPPPRSPAPPPRAPAAPAAPR